MIIKRINKTIRIVIRAVPKARPGPMYALAIASEEKKISNVRIINLFF